MMRIGYRHADRLISYPHAHNLSVSQLPIRVGGRFRRPGGQARMERPGRSAAECFGAWLRRRRRRQNSPCTSRAVPLPVQNSPCSLEMPRFGAFCVCRANFVPHTRWTRSQSTQPHTKRHWCGGRRRDQRARPRCRWVAAGPGRVHQRHSIAGAAGV